MTPAVDASQTPDDDRIPVDPETSPTLVFDERSTKHSWLEDVLGLVTGTFAVALGLTFLRASDAATGGTAGLALIIDFASGWPFWLIFASINLPFAVLAVWKKGWDFTLRTVASIGLVSAFTALDQAAFAFDRLDPIFGTFGGNLLCGVGLLIVFRHRGSLGGVNIIGLVIQERTGFRAGWTLMIFDTAIILAAFLVLPWPNVLLSAAGAVVLNLVLALNHRPGRYIGR